MGSSINEELERLCNGMEEICCGLSRLKEGTLNAEDAAELKDRAERVLYLLAKLAESAKCN